MLIVFKPKAVLKKEHRLSTNDEVIIVAPAFFELSAMFLESCRLPLEVTNTGSRKGVSQDMGERYCYAKEYAANNDGTDDIRCAVRSCSWLVPGCNDRSGEQPSTK